MVWKESGCTPITGSIQINMFSNVDYTNFPKLRTSTQSFVNDIYCLYHLW